MNWNNFLLGGQTIVSEDGSNELQFLPLYCGAGLLQFRYLVLVQDIFFASKEQLEKLDHSDHAPWIAEINSQVGQK